MKIGDKVWIKDENHRVYVDDEGQRYNAPIYRKKFVERYIAGETRVSWLLTNSKEVNEWHLKHAKKIKKNDAHRIIFTSEDQIDRHCWAIQNHYRIADLVRGCEDFYKLKKIEEILK